MHENKKSAGRKRINLFIHEKDIQLYRDDFCDNNFLFIVIAICNAQKGKCILGPRLELSTEPVSCCLRFFFPLRKNLSLIFQYKYNGRLKTQEHCNYLRESVILQVKMIELRCKEFFIQIVLFVCLSSVCSEIVSNAYLPPKRCPVGSVGTYPNCKCKEPFTGIPPNCQAPGYLPPETQKCPPGYYGTYPVKEKLKFSRQKIF